MTERDWLHIATVPKGAPVRAIVRIAAEEFGVSETDIYSHRRPRVVSAARRAISFVARRHTGYSYPQIARAMKLDHTSVLTQVKMAEEHMKTDPAFAKKVATIERRMAA